MGYGHCAVYCGLVNIRTHSLQLNFSTICRTKRMEDKVEIAAFCYCCRKCVIVTDWGEWQSFSLCLMRIIWKMKTKQNNWKLFYCALPFKWIYFYTKTDDLSLSIPYRIFRYVSWLRCTYLLKMWKKWVWMQWYLWLSLFLFVIFMDSYFLLFFVLFQCSSLSAIFHIDEGVAT